MPRQPRIDIPGLLQHVILRGVARSDLFRDDDDRIDFVRRLSQLLEATETRCYAWTLLDNHVHLLLMPTRQPLAPLMQRLLTGYAIAFNLRHNRSGHLFQNRYKSIVCDDDAYLLELVRYIHLNPLRAGIVDDLDGLGNYPWSGHRQLLGKGAFDVIAAAELLPFFGKGAKRAVARYREFLADGLQGDSPATLSRGGRGASQSFNPDLQDDELYDERILGGGDFVAHVLGANSAPAVRLSLPQLVTLVARHCKLAEADLALPNKQPAFVHAKALICFAGTRLCRFKGRDVGKRLAYSPPAVSRAALRGKALYDQDDVLQSLLNREM